MYGSRRARKIKRTRKVRHYGQTNNHTKVLFQCQVDFIDYRSRTIGKK